MADDRTHEMVERVARAISKSRYGQEGFWEDLVQEARDHIAALTALDYLTESS